MRHVIDYQMSDKLLNSLLILIRRQGCKLRDILSINNFHFQLKSEEHTRRRLSTVAARAKQTAARRSSSNQSTKHVRARQSPYPNSNQQRYPVPDFLIAWQGVFPGYDPPLYTAVEVQASLLWADVDILQKTSSAIIFNCVENGINRRSYTGLIDVVNRLPRNPVGRTGIAGRGLFGRWGPNHAAHLVATRWKEDEDGNTIQKEGKNVLEFVAVRRPDIAEWSVPGGLVNVGDSVSVTLKKVLDKKILPALKPTFSDGKENLDESLDFMIQNAVEVYKGYVDDPRNTDNAWMETVVLNFHDEPRKTLGDFEFEAREGIRSVKWQEVSSHINLQVNYHLILKKVAELRKAYF